MIVLFLTALMIAILALVWSAFRDLNRPAAKQSAVAAPPAGSVWPPPPAPPVSPSPPSPPEPPVF